MHLTVGIAQKELGIYQDNRLLIQFSGRRTAPFPTMPAKLFAIRPVNPSAFTHNGGTFTHNGGTFTHNGGIGMRPRKFSGSLMAGASALLLASGAAIAQQQQVEEAEVGEALAPAEAVSEGAPVHVSPSSIAAIQRMLNEAGYAAGPVDGVWGPDTATAIATFQRDQGLDATGTMTFETLHAVGLGGVLTGEDMPEPVAGVGVPQEEPEAEEQQQ